MNPSSKTITQLSLNKVQETFKPGKWIPFIFGMIVIGLLSVLFFYQSVHQQVSKTSRCKRVRDMYTGSGTYSVSERAGNGATLYEVSYNFGSKKTETFCRCPKGSILNVFYIPLRDLFNNKDKISTLNCSCDDDYAHSIRVGDPTSRVYEGYPELINYMREQKNDEFFRKPAAVSF